MTYRFSLLESRDATKIDKLNTLTNPDTFWDDVRKFTKNVTSDHSLGRWQCLAEMRYNELMTGCEDVRCELEEYGKPFRYYNRKTGEEVFYRGRKAV